MATTHIGGTFAPPLSDDLLREYGQRIAALGPGPVRDTCHRLLCCCSAWWDLPESDGSGTPHPSGRGTVVALDQFIRAALYDLIPWDHELQGMATVLDALPADTDEQRALRNLAFHLMWHVKELNLDREPITSDKL